MYREMGILVFGSLGGDSSVNVALLYTQFFLEIFFFARIGTLAYVFVCVCTKMLELIFLSRYFNRQKIKSNGPY